MNAERQTVYRWSFIWSGALVALVGAVLLGVAITRSDAWERLAGVLGLSALGWGGLVQTLNALVLMPMQSAARSSAAVQGTQYLWAGTAIWLVRPDGSDAHVIECLRFQCAIDGSRASWRPLVK